MDDILYLKTGDQIPADSKVLEGSIEVNESLLTGESDNLQKNEGDELFSGSFVTAGEACCQVIHVGKDNYAAQITSEAKEFKRHNSELRNSLNAILKTISVIIVPMGLLLFYKQYYIAGKRNPGCSGEYGSCSAWNDSGGTGASYQCGADPWELLPLPERIPWCRNCTVLRLWQEWIPCAWIRPGPSQPEPCVWSRWSHMCRGCPFRKVWPENEQPQIPPSCLMQIMPASAQYLR